MMGAGARAQSPSAVHLLGAGRPLLLPADRLLVSEARSGARGRQGLLDDEGWRRRPADRHHPAVAHGGHVRPRECGRWPTSGALPVAGLSLITFCIYLGAVGKSAQFPLHVWLPDAMEGPTPVSALIHAATMVTAGVYLLLAPNGCFALPPDVLLVVAWIGAFTALLAAVLACVQDDIKRVLAYSTVSQLGYMMAAIGAGFSAAGFFHLLTHGILQGAALPRRRCGDSRGAQQRPVADGRPRAEDAADGDRLRRSARCRWPASRCSAGSCRRKRSSARAGRRSRRSVRAADGRRVPDGVLHVPRRVPGVLRESSLKPGTDAVVGPA